MIFFFVESAHTAAGMGHAPDTQASHVLFESIMSIVKEQHTSLLLVLHAHGQELAAQTQKLRYAGVSTGLFCALVGLFCALVGLFGSLVALFV